MIIIIKHFYLVYDISHGIAFQFFADLKFMENFKENFENNGNLVIISETDLHGTIISANDPFCVISGYSREELIGSPHNIIRHPSMPKDLFRHLWMTIQKGEVFRGIIKNLSKEGYHYWVNATIMPVFQGGKIVRYVGGRHLLNDDNLAEDLFKKQMAGYQNRA